MFIFCEGKFNWEKFFYKRLIWVKCLINLGMGEDLFMYLFEIEVIELFLFFVSLEICKGRGFSF